MCFRAVAAISPIGTSLFGSWRPWCVCVCLCSCVFICVYRRVYESQHVCICMSVVSFAYVWCNKGERERERPSLGLQKHGGPCLGLQKQHMVDHFWAFKSNVYIHMYISTHIYIFIYICIYIHTCFIYKNIFIYDMCTSIHVSHV